MSKKREQVDFSGLFKLDVLVHLNILNHSFYEVGLKKFLAFSSENELVFLYIDPQSNRYDKNYDWDFVDNPVYSMCFDPSGTWLLIISEQKVLLVPFLPLFTPQNSFDCKWSLSSVTVLPLTVISKPICVVWWLTKESEDIIIIGSKTGLVTFYSLESQSIVGETKVPGEINELYVCYDDSLDILALVICGTKYHRWKLILEHRSICYNWLQQTHALTDKDKKDTFLSYIRSSKDKLNSFIQGGSKDKHHVVEHALQPVDYKPSRKWMERWSLAPQYVNGRHFLTVSDLVEGTLMLEVLEDATPSRIVDPIIKKDGLYLQGLWSQRLIYFLKENEVEVHSTYYSDIQSDETLLVKRSSTQLWAAKLIGEARCIYLMSTKEPLVSNGPWSEPTFLCDLKIPRFALEPCLVITTRGAYLLNTSCDPCEWLVALKMRVAFGSEKATIALQAPAPTLLRAAGDMLLSRGNVNLAHQMYTLSKGLPDGWVARLGVFGRINHVAAYDQRKIEGILGNTAFTLKLLALTMKIAINDNENYDLKSLRAKYLGEGADVEQFFWRDTFMLFGGNCKDIQFTKLNSNELLELSAFAAATGLWELVHLFSVCRGYPDLVVNALKLRNNICRGTIVCLLKYKFIVPMLLQENGQWFFDFLNENCCKLDTVILKRLCLWLNPLQDQLRCVMRDMKQGITSIYTTRMIPLISSFIRIASVIESREPCPVIHQQITPNTSTWRNHFKPRRTLSCGLAHWAVVDDGKARVMNADVPIDTDIIGRVIDIACGRHHTLILTENGIYGAGDNSYGQLGLGRAWWGGGGGAGAGGVPARVPARWAAPPRAVAAGHYHSAALDAGGRLYTWGWGVHGQLGHGNAEDVWSPKLVTKFQGRKVLSVGCGACHTVVLTKNGEVWAMGAGAFGQLGSGAREKATVPVRVPLTDHVDIIAVGYFHNLALTARGQIWWWGGSPQQVRAANARAAGGEPARDPPVEPHLAPRVLDLPHVQGLVQQMAVGWHHCCLLDNYGTLYTWGLNFDGQLGSGDRKQVCIPQEVAIGNSSRQDNETKFDEESKALIGCGGDFTVYISDDGRIYAAGNVNSESNSEKEKDQNRVIMMKTTKRVIKIPANRSNYKFLFLQIDRLDLMFPFDIVESQRKPLEPAQNPLISINDFKKETWADDLIFQLKPWIKEDDLDKNLNMAAKLAYHNNIYADCLQYLLENLKSTPQDDRVYLAHTDAEDYEKFLKNTKYIRKVGDHRLLIKNAILKRIKDISLSVINKEPYPDLNVAMYKTLPCCCDELSYLKKTSLKSVEVEEVEQNLSIKAAKIIDTCISMFPVDSELWESCFRIAKNFYLENNLSVAELETVLRKYMESNATTMAAAIMYSNDCAQYSKILSPKFYLNMCSQVLDTWG